MYRSYIAQKKYAVVLDEVVESSPAELQAVRLLAEYLHSPSRRQAVCQILLGNLATILSLQGVYC